MVLMSQHKFSRRTVIAAIELMASAEKTQAGLTRFLLKCGQDVAARCEEGPLPERFNHLIKFCDEQPDHRLEDDKLLMDELVEQAASLLLPLKTNPPWRSPPTPKPEKQAVSFLRLLAFDGFTVTDGSLRSTLPEDLGLPQVEDEITRLLKKHHFTTPKGHLDQALVAHGRGEWAAANSQLRTFFESLLDEIAISLDPSAANLPSGENRRARLATMKFLSEDLNEWGNDGKNFTNGLWKRLHPAGSHPGLSDQDDSTFRRHIVLLTSQLFLVRFDARKNP